MSDADQDTEENIRMRAYLLWELEGRQRGGRSIIGTPPVRS
jgi:hypothetical protein